MNISISKLRSEIRDSYQKLGTWQKVAEHYGVHRSVVWRIANQGYVPKDNDLRQQLNLPQIVERTQSRDARGRFASNPED